MEEITFSVFNHGPAAMKNLPVLVEKFEQQYGIRVRLEVIPSSNLRWSRLVEVALYHSGPDISEVGSTWVGDLVRMEALRPFAPDEINEITGGTRYFDSVWQGSVKTDQGVSTVYSIPLSADTRQIFYRRDLLEKAGVAEATAFEDFAHLETTLECLRASHLSMPLVLTTQPSNMTVHFIASWVWGAGGDFLSSDGTSLAFDQPLALEGCKTYYRLGRFLSAEARGLLETEADDAFIAGKAAVLPSGFWIPSNQLTDEVRQNLGAAPMPGKPFVGGSNLVVWNYSRHASSAIKLIQFLHSKVAVELLYPAFGLPISEKDWGDPPFDTAVYQVFRTCLQRGRGLPIVRLWGLVEKRLTDVFADIWDDVLRSPRSSPDAVVESHLKGLARRLQLTLEL